MTEFLQHQSSIAYYDENRPGCTWGLFHLLNFHRHANSRKLLSYWRHKDGELGGETKVPTSRPKVLNRSLDKEVNYKMEDQASKKSSGKVPMLSSLFKRMTKKRERKMKSSPSASRLLRTISIHHLECNDYVAHDEMTSESEHSRRNDPSYMVAEAKERGKSVALQSEYDADKEPTSRVFQDRRSVSVNQLQTRQASMEEMELIKSASFPGAGPKEKHKNKVSSLIQDLKSQSAKIISRHKTVEEPSKALESEISDDTTVNSSQLDHRKEFKKDWLRISMDGILHKVPSGHNLPEYIEKERLKLGASGLVYGSAKSEYRSMQRSRSLVESLDRYSPLLESISDREPKRVPERLKSLKEDDDNRRVLRSRSLTESAYRSSHLIKSSSVREPRRAIERVASVRENNVLPERKSMKILGKILSNPEILQYPFSKDIQSYESHEKASGLLVSKDVDTYVSDCPKLVDSLVNTKEGTSTVEPNDSEAVDNLERQTEINHEQDEDEACTIPGNSWAEDNCSASLHEKNEVEMEQNATITEPTPASVLGTRLEEDVVDPEKYEYEQIEGPELPPSWIQFEEQDCRSNPEDHLGDCEATTKEDEDVELIKQQLPDLNETSSLHIPVREKDENEFNYVIDILRKSGLTTGGGAEEFLWHVEGSAYHDHEPIEDGALDTPDLDRQLMLDVMNEVILGIYESSIARSTKFTSCDPCIRPVPTGDRVLEEVWAKISWYLASEQCSSNPLDNVVARDFARSDGWMDLHWDMEGVGLEVEDMILDELIDEVLL